MRERKHVFQNIDWILIALWLILVLFGWINIYASVYNPENFSIFDLSQRYGKQMLWIIAAIALGFMIILIDPKFFNQFSYLIYFLILLILISVLLFGKEVAGSKSWFQIGSFALQPAEFMKFATSLALAHFLSTQEKTLTTLRSKFFATVIIMVPAALVLLQNDTGSALVFTAFILVLYRFGLSGNIFVIGFVAIFLGVLALLLSTVVQKIILIGILLIPAIVIVLMMKKTFRNIAKITGVVVLIVVYIFSVDFAFSKLQPHQQIRIKVLLNMESDPQGAGYNVLQSKIAVGSGGFSGKGFLNGTQTKFDFVPEQSTDFIFCTVGEEWGFVGSFLVVALFTFLLIRLVLAAERQRSLSSKIYGYSVASILFFHFTINLGMVLGLLPVIGIPLPFFSYGGSSLWAFTILLFIFIRQDAERMQLL
ncbi:MAG: rod shape-determining protein RodA [Bacteroidales bacterium]|nr:rod shape-determining protein RodA [Bacteroidales bacterium]